MFKSRVLALLAASLLFPAAAMADNGRHLGWYKNGKHHNPGKHYSQELRGPSRNTYDYYDYRRPHYEHRRPDYRYRRPYEGWGGPERPGYSWGSWGGNSVESRINRGLSTGELTHREASDLRRYQSDLERRRAQYMADGYLSSSERERLRDRAEDIRENLHHNLRDGEHR